MEPRSSVATEAADRCRTSADDGPGTPDAPKDDLFRRIIRRAVAVEREPGESGQARREVELRKNRSGE